jgi:quercetin dioxygenase-like cupin family protein
MNGNATMRHGPTAALVCALAFGALACEPRPTADEPRTDIPPAAERPAEPPAIADRAPDEHIIEVPGEIAWRDAPASLEPGAHVAVLEGDPGEQGFFNMRIRMPDGYHIAPHRHPNVERVTVISGTFRLGMGEELDRAAAQPLRAGSYFAMPPGEAHYGIAEGETVIQLTTIGPWQIEYVNPADDPRRRQD